MELSGGGEKRLCVSQLGVPFLQVHAGCLYPSRLGPMTRPTCSLLSFLLTTSTSTSTWFESCTNKNKIKKKEQLPVWESGRYFVTLVLVLYVVVY